MAAWQRFYLGYHGRFQEDVELALPSGQQVAVSQAPSASSNKRGPHSTHNKKGQVHESKVKDPSLTGTTVWDGSICLAMTLTSSPDLISKGHASAIELGAGCALVSLALAAERLMSSCCITDLQEMIPSIECQVKKNAQVLGDSRREGSPALISVRALRWGPEGEEEITLIEEELERGRVDQTCSTEEEEVSHLKPATTSNHFDIIVGADLIYYSYSEETPHTRLLLWTLKRLCGPNSVVYLALSLHHNPDEVDSFLSLAENEGFLVKQLIKEVPEDYRVEDVKVVRLTLG